MESGFVRNGAYGKCRFSPYRWEEIAILNVTYAEMSQKGDRSINEEYVLSFSEARSKSSVFVLCDGLGGHEKGDEASKLVANNIHKYYTEGQPSMEEAILYAQNKLLVFQDRQKMQEAMRTTVVCLELSKDMAIAKFGHVGDSRIYLFQKNKYKLRSIDHSVPQMLALRGAIRDKDIRYHEDRSKLLRVMGSRWEHPCYQISEEIQIDRKSTFLLCSDGFWELIDEKQMSTTLKKAKTPEEWLLSMEKIILSNGQGKNMDNYSAIAVFIR